MNQFRLFLLVLIGLLTGPALAQTTPTGTVRGHIQAASGESLLGISVGLEGTGLGSPTDARGDFIIRQVPAGTYALVATGLGYQATKQNVTVAAGRATALNLQLTENQQELTEVVVTGAADPRRYAEPVSELGTRTSARLLDVPLAIQAVPQQVLRDQQAQTLTEALRNVAGVATYSGFMDYVLRGFRTNFNGSNFTTNGVRGVFYDFSQVPPLYNVERIEVMKGPASVLFSAGAPGGVINTVTKQPLARPEYAASVSYGSFGQRRATADATGPLAAGGRLRYRAIVGYEQANSFRDYQQSKNVYLAPSLSYVGDRAQLTAELNYMAENSVVGYDRGLVATTRADGSYNFEAVPLSWSHNNADDHTWRRSWSAQLDYRQQLGTSSSLRTLLRYSQYQFRNFQYDSYGPPASDSLTDRLYEVYPIDFYSVNSNTYFTTTRQTGAVRHALTAGFDVGVFRNPYSYNFFTAPSISLFNPDRSLDNPATFPLAYAVDVRDRSLVLGAYVQDQLALGEHWKALLALRFDRYDYVVNFTQTAPALPFERDVRINNALLPRLGLVYAPTAATSLYASYTESFNPNADNYTLSVQGGPFKAEQGIQYEVGAKKEWAGGRVMTTLAAYQITKANVLVPDPTDPLGLRQNSRGEARSRGVELTGQGQLTADLAAVANYAYNQAIITQDNNPANVGNGLPNAPRHVGNAWLKYTASRGPLRGLGLGAGGNFSGRKVIEGPQDLKLPGYVSFEAAVSYAYRGATLALNAYNLANTRNFSGGYSQGVLYVQPPRSFRLQLSYLLRPGVE